LGASLKFISFVIYIPLQIVFFPLGILGVIMVVYRQLAISKKIGTSQTAIEILNGRWTMHMFALRKDEAAVQLANVLPNTSPLGLWLVLLPLWIKQKIAGEAFLYPKIESQGRETIANFIFARTSYIDAIVKRSSGEVEQMVILGAGFDTRAYGELKESGMRFFEVDQHSTQRVKTEWLTQANIDASHVTFVTVDFSKESTITKLKENGYDPKKKTLFLWEGVTLYLSVENVRSMLRELKRDAVGGSQLIADFYAERFLAIGKAKAGKKALNLTDENLRFGFALDSDYQSTFADFAASEDLKIAQTYYLGSSDNKGPFMIVSETIL